MRSPGCGVIAAQAIIAELGLDMTVFGTSGRLVSWAKRCPQTRQSGQKTTHGKQGKGNPYLNGVLGEIAASAARTDTFLGERYRRIARRRGKRKALAANARSILIIIYHLLADPEARYHDLGPDYYDTAPTATARSATTSASSRPSAWTSPSPPPDKPPDRRPGKPAAQTAAGCCRLPP